MFLMKSPPLVTLQRKWEPFSPSRSCRYPICFSESEDDIAPTTVSAKVQMIINKLQTDESSLGTSDEYGCTVQKKQKGAKSRGPKLQGSARALQEHVAYGQHHCPADSDGMEVEESEFGPISLHSDSDDSVDRDIEAAIQEYLRNKGQGVQHLPGSPENFHGTDGCRQFHKEYPTRDAACDLFPANVKAEVVQQHLAPGHLGDGTVQWATSPCSTSSNDSFEQSIKAEIEQFLKEKKQRERERLLAGEGERLDPKDPPESLALRSQKEGANCLQRSSSKRRGKPLFLRQLPEPQSGSALPKCLQAGTPEEPANFKKASQAHPRTAVVGHSSMPEPSREGKIRQKLWETQKEQNAMVSDSSSDDGIEEAIQLYQLEKSKKEANAQTGRVAFPKDPFRAGGIVDISTSLTIRSEKSAVPGTRHKGRGKQLSLQLVEPSRLGAACAEPEKGRHCALAVNRFASCAVEFQASYHSDTTAELMCAEAILDISKTILPPTMVSNDRSLLADPYCIQSALPSCQESDSNAVDSDDSIEQEIRAFLAAKAQAECLAAKSKENQRAAQSMPSSGQPGDQSRSPKQSQTAPNICRTRQLSLSHKRKPKRVTGHIQDKPETLPEIGCSPEDHSKLFAAPSQDAAGVLKVEGCLQEALTTVSSAHFANAPLQGLRRTEERVKTTSHASQKSSMDDKSSSLDSDEDLDTAIKELLRSKRKLRKKPKDQRVQCKKKVKFGDTELHVLEDNLSGNLEGGCKSRTAPLLKGCLTNTKSRPQTVVKGKPNSAKADPLGLEYKKEGHPKSISGPDNQEAGKQDHSPWLVASLTGDSSSVDSDDGIEQEIQRFLAEKAKDITSATAASKTVEPQEVAKLQTSPPKARHQLWQIEGHPLSRRRKKVKKAGPPMKKPSSPLSCVQNTAGDSPCQGKWTMASVEDVGSQSPEKLQRNQGIVEAEGANSSIKRPAIGDQAVSDIKCPRKSLALGKAVTGNSKQKNNIKPRSSLKRKNRPEFKISSKFIESLKRAKNRKTSAPVEKGPDPKVVKREGSDSASELSESCVAALSKGVLGSSSEAEVSEADLPTVKRLQPYTPESPGKTQGLSIEATENPARGLECPGNAEASQGLPLQAPNTDGSIRGAKVSNSSLEAPFEEQEGRSQRPSTSWREHSVPTSPMKENSLTSPDRLAGSGAQEVLEGSSPEFTDGPMEELTPCLTNSKPSFVVSTSIDPGWNVLPYIVLSPTQLLASKTLAVQDRRRALQEGNGINPAAHDPQHKRYPVTL